MFPLIGPCSMWRPTLAAELCCGGEVVWPGRDILTRQAGGRLAFTHLARRLAWAKVVTWAGVGPAHGQASELHSRDKISLLPSTVSWNVNPPLSLCQDRQVRKSLPGYYGIRGKIQLWGYGIWMGRMSQSGSLPKRQQTPALLAQKSYTHSLIWLKPEDQDRIVYLQAEGFVINWWTCLMTWDGVQWQKPGMALQVRCSEVFLTKLILKSF